MVFLLPKVKLESNRRIKVKSGGSVEMNPIYKYMFRLFYFWIHIQVFSRSLRVIRGQTWGNPSNSGQIGRLVEIYQIYICLDSEFSQEFRFNVFQVQLGSSEVELGSNPSKSEFIVNSRKRLWYHRGFTKKLVNSEGIREKDSEFIVDL